jgi:TRAP-type C4-dicarboxylate transport system substrate-binding protein
VKKLLSGLVPPWQRDALPFVFNDQNELLAVGNVLVSDALARLPGNALNWQPPSEYTS